MGESTEKESLTPAPAAATAPQCQLEDKAPPARTCCGNVAYTVGKNTADAYLKKEGEVSAAAQHFNKEAKNKNKNTSACIIQ